MEAPSKMSQLKNTGKKAADKLSNAASNAGTNLMKLIKNADTTPELQLSELEIMKQKKEGQVLFFIFFFVGILIFIILVFISKTFRVYTTLQRLEIYQSNEINAKSIIKIVGTDNLGQKKLRDYYIASAYKPYVCYYHKYDYCSLEVFRQVLCAGPRMIELEIFNDSFSVDVEPVVSSGTSDGEWQLAINSLPFPDVLKTIASTVFNQKYVDELNDDPFIIYLNLKNNKNVICLEKISKYLYEILGQFLLDIKYSYNSNKGNSKFNDITLDNLIKKIVIFSSPGFEGSPLEEVVNYSVASDYTLENNPEQYRILYLRNSTIVEKAEDIEEFNNTTHYKVSKDNLKEYNKCGLTIVSPGVEDNGFFDGITPFNPEPTKSLESGCQFIMMNYQMIDTNMSNYTYIFKDSSFVEKSDSLKDDLTDSTCTRKFTSVKTQKLEHTNSEVVYTYVTPKDKIENTQ
jgi:hypothetical protein